MAKKKKIPAEEISAEEEKPAEEIPEEEAPAKEAGAETDKPVSTELDEEIISDLTELDEDEDLSEIPVEEPEAEPEADAKAVEEKPSEEEEAPKPEEVSAEDEAAKAAAEKQAADEKPTAVEPVQPTPEEVAESQAKWRKDTEEALSVGHFALSEELAEEIEENPGTAIPKLMSKVYLDAVQNATAAVVQLLPQILEKFQSQQSQANGLETQFFETWDKLDPKEHGETLQKLGTAYRAANPNASPDEFIRDVGAATMIALKIPHEEIQEAIDTPAQVPAHKPLTPGGAPAAKSTTPDNQFTQLAEEVISDGDL